ncbi:Uncharacterised protein [uncultured archaeon]|nr:Uncharacterised protein [uncultured archaeon]
MGPYNISLNLPDYNDITVAGPVGSSETGYIYYLLSMEKMNNTTSNLNKQPPKILVQVTRYSRPINIDDGASLSELYDDMASKMFPEGTVLRKMGVMIDGHWPAYWQTPGCNVMNYFLDHNTQVTVGGYGTSPHDNELLQKTFHIVLS